jgi:cholesterol transport system auxiliary component
MKQNQGQSTIFRTAKKRGLSLFFCASLGACGGSAQIEPRSYDLGLEAPATRLAGVRVGAVRAVAPFESTDMQYRLAYRNAAEVAAYASSRWAATPAEMFRKQLLRASGAGPAKCVLEVEIQEFSQVFGAKETSDARIELRARLSSGAKSLARHFTVVESNAGPDAVGGAAAAARASNRAIAELGGWIGAQSDCR